ncbi:MAG: chemotaxis protein CheW [Spirochaetales bacterium]|nr:chemotaxis protein CheW [Spirochaetales bacterium]
MSKKNINKEAKVSFTDALDDDEEDMLVSQLNMDVSDQFVIFSIGEEEYGIPILTVQEIISLPSLSTIPGSPDYIPGIINLRGNIIPLYILRKKFNMDDVELSSKSIVIIVETGTENKKTVGFIVDNVSNVISIEKKDLSDPPDVDLNIDASYIKQIGKIASRMIMILDLENFFSENEKLGLDKISEMAI